MIIDAHHHIWNLAERAQTWMTPAQAEVIGRNFTIDDWAAAATPAGVTRSVIVQTVENSQETVELLALAANTDSILGVVGWVDFVAHDLQAQFSLLREHPGAAKLVSVRDLTEYRPDPDWLAGPEASMTFAVAGHHDLAIDLLIKPEHVPSATRAVLSQPDTRFIINHLAKPNLDSTQAKDWGASMRGIAESPNTALKFSGVATLTRDFHASRVRVHEYFDEALRLFGADRIMFGSDWPVSLIGTQYSDLVASCEESLESLSQTEREAIWHGTASHWYQLPRDSESNETGRPLIEVER